MNKCASGLLTTLDYFPKVKDMDPVDFCNRFQARFPTAAQIMANMDKTTSSDIEGSLVGELESKVI